MPQAPTDGLTPDVAPAVDEANTENFLVNFFEPQCGHAPVSLDDRTSNSNSLSHLEQTYSNIGMTTSFHSMPASYRKPSRDETVNSVPSVKTVCARRTSTPPGMGFA
jgi:hypothetical protein